jgi:hypothetical protein
MSENTPLYVIALDIETTGAQAVPDATRNGAHDEILSVGFAVYDARAPAQGAVFTALVNHALGKPPKTSWSDYWTERGFERRCFDEFWSTRLPLLEETQRELSPASASATRYEVTVHNRSELASTINALAAQFEKRYDVQSMRYASDAAEFDRHWLATLMQSEGYHSLAHTRQGQFRWWVDDLNTASYELGRVRAERGTEDSEREIAAMRGTLAHLGTEYTHRADDDAADIGKNVVAAMHWKRRRTDVEHAYTAIDSEIAYQTKHGATWDHGGRPSVEAELLLVQRYARLALDAWAVNHGNTEALHEVRKLAAICTRCMAHHSALPRTVVAPAPANNAV